MNAVVCSLYAVYIQATAHLCHWSGRVMATPIHPPRVASNSSRRLSGRELFLIIFLIPCVSGTRPSANKEPTSARTGDGAAKGTLGRRVKGCQPCLLIRSVMLCSSMLQVTSQQQCRCQATEDPCGEPGSLQAIHQVTLGRCVGHFLLRCRVAETTLN